VGPGRRQSSVPGCLSAVPRALSSGACEDAILNLQQCRWSGMPIVLKQVEVAVCRALPWSSQRWAGCAALAQP